MPGFANQGTGAGLAVSDVMRQVRRLFGDDSGAQISDSDLFDWINEAQRSIAVENDLLQTSLSGDTTANTQNYSIPTDMLKFVALYVYGLEAKFVNFNEFRSKYTTPFANPVTSNLPLVYTIYNDQLLIYPTPQNSTNDGAGLLLYYIKKPVKVTQSTDPLTLPAVLHTAIRDWVLKRAYQMDGDWQGANAAGTDYMNGLRSGAMDVNERREADSYGYITSSAGDYGL